MVTETVTRIPLQDLQTMRVKCNNPKCGKLVEASLATMTKAFPQGRCAFCHEILFDEMSGGDPFQKLVDAVDLLAKLQSRFAVEFVLPQPKPAA